MKKEKLHKSRRRDKYSSPNKEVQTFKEVQVHLTIVPSEAKCEFHEELAVRSLQKGHSI